MSLNVNVTLIYTVDKKKLVEIRAFDFIFLLFLRIERSVDYD